MTKRSKRKHVTKIEVKVKGVTSWVLLDAWGEQILGYTIFMNALIKDGSSYNTRRNYALFIARFYDYLFEVALVYGGLTEELLEDACEAYETYMIKGKLVKNYPLIEKVIAGLPSPMLKTKSYDPHHSALQKFLKLSSKTSKHLNQLKNSGLDQIQEQLSDIALFDYTRSALTRHQQGKIIRNSVFASTISGGAKMASVNILERKFPSSSGTSNYFDEEAKERTFPWDKFQELLDAAPNWRAKVLWSLIAAIGCRFSEAIAILNSDVDVIARKVYLVAAKERPGMYPYLNVDELEKLAFKTRETRNTFMIVWGKSFFKYLLEYRKSEEYRVAVRHGFLFQSMNPGKYGQPQVFCSYQSMLATFQDAVKKVLGKDASSFGFHSLRHMYGFYLKNYAPRADGGYGFELSDVQTYMGHANPSQTKRYALDEKEKLEMKIIYANEASLGRNGPETLLNLQLERNQREYKQLMKIAKERELKIADRLQGRTLND